MTLISHPPWNVLIFPAASEIGIEISRALSFNKEVVLHGATQPDPNVAVYHFQHLHQLPPISDTHCLESLQKLILDHDIHAIFPAYDDVTVWLSENKGKLKAQILAPDSFITNLCRSKKRTYEYFSDILPSPYLWKHSEIPDQFPVFVKPDKGQGSQRARLIADVTSLHTALTHEPDLIIMEYLPGPEYTIDCFSQKENGIVFVQPRIRLQTKTGIATVSQTVELPEAQDWAHKIFEKLKITGPWFFQLKVDKNGNLRLLEIGPRIAGSMALSRVMGPNFPLLALYDAAGYSLKISSIRGTFSLGRSLDLSIQHNLTIEAIYIDLDDTLVLRERVNHDLMALIFQAYNKKIPINLLTRHKGNLSERLKTFRLAQLFDNIFHIQDDKLPKSHFIAEKNAILIDDSFAERQEVSETLGIPCFDAAAAVCLIDRRK